jgi:hypothetical protein
MTHVNAAGRFENCCEDCDCTLPLPHVAHPPGKPLSIREELVARITRSLTNYPTRTPEDQARNIVSWLTLDFDIDRSAIR